MIGAVLAWFGWLRLGITGGILLYDTIPLRRYWCLSLMEKMLTVLLDSIPLKVVRSQVEY